MNDQPTIARRFVEKAKAEGRIRISGFLPPDASRIVAEMIKQGMGKSPAECVALALRAMVYEEERV